MEWIQFWLLMILERRAPKSLGQTELEDHRQSKKIKSVSASRSIAVLSIGPSTPKI